MRWTLKPNPDPEVVKDLADSLNVEQLVAQLLVQRGITNYDEAKAFFRPQLYHLHDPYLMKDMDLAVSRIQKAIQEEERILVYGDYDVDGTTSVALMSSYLRSKYPHIDTYIPDRYGEGYGVSFQGIDYAEDNGISLIIALDCGIKAIDKVSYAKEKGIDFIICDHHRPGSLLPDAVAVLDPKRADCSYPYKELCGCGVGFKLIQALGETFGEDIQTLLPYLDLVATAIGADIVPITGENRVLSFYGLQQINSNPRAGFRAIIEQTKKREFTNTDVVFIIAPRINAAGRMEHGRHAVALLTETDLQQAREMASGIEQFNTDRKGLDQEITDEALDQIRANREEERFTSVVYKDSWHKGVIGIVASRLTETYYRPTLVFTKSGEKLAASARSVKGFDVYEALEGCADCIEQFGGHKYAAGLTLSEAQFSAFKERFEQVVAASIDPALLTPEITVDARISLSQVSPRLLRILSQFAPFGPGNHAPVFMAERLQDTGYAKTVGGDHKHLKLSVIQKGSNPLGAIGFNLGHHLSTVQGGKFFDAVFALEENEWNGLVSMQLKLKDLR
ncbi:single-stranded-DNA-specific exonuclease RecJ [Zeaxanthinibacter sp. PT1]|uniref:single-stranded-DNA-specific exonuclease RecJ n=1 Tax=Zeaxanthinibacter TaxID=561554 RepID=UPI00234BDD82|nr:single-stranded-DNA-specific exonuclease RecJ [Zeaxanthinibacter sp. PT1]MDC6350827.1 single-stranded-DNA-specific exonuclease RecJ [Zeaxanthinibacter sp. PT1]